MKLDNKGLTLIELLVSLVLVATVLIFLFQLLTRLSNETESNNYAYNNQLNRIEAVSTIEKDLSKYSLVGIRDNSANNGINLMFRFQKNGNFFVTILTNDIKNDKHYLNYTTIDSDGNSLKYSWEMKGGIIDPCGEVTYYVDNESDDYNFKIIFKIYNSNGNEENSYFDNNSIDDIEIFYAGRKDKLNYQDNSYLFNEIGNHVVQVGTCN